MFQAPTSGYDANLAHGLTQVSLPGKTPVETP